MRSTPRPQKPAEFADRRFSVGAMHISHDMGQTFHSVQETCDACLKRESGAVAGVITRVDHEAGVVEIDWHHEDGK